MVEFLASLTVSVLLTMYMLFVGHIIHLTSSISWWFSLIVFIISLAIAIDFFTKVSSKK